MTYLKSSRFLKPSLMLCILWMELVTDAQAENCRIQLSETTVDYGNLTRAAIMGKTTSAPNVSLGDRQMALNVLCQSATKIGLIVNGAAAQDNFKFGDSGQFTVLLSDALLDGKPVNLRSSQADGKQAAEPGATLAVTPGARVAPLIAGQHVPGKNLSLLVGINAKVTDDATKVRGETTWQGNVAFKVVER